MQYITYLEIATNELMTADSLPGAHPTPVSCLIHQFAHPLNDLVPWATLVMVIYPLMRLPINHASKSVFCPINYEQTWHGCFIVVPQTTQSADPPLMSQIACSDVSWPQSLKHQLKHAACLVLFTQL